MYKLSPLGWNETQYTSVINLEKMCAVPFDPANTDYANFKREINDETAQLQDANGVLMTPEQAKDFVKELP